MVAKLGRPLYLNMLKALEVSDPDELCPNVTDEEIVSLREVRAENAEFFDQIGFAAALFTLSVGFHVGLFLPGPVLQTKEQDEL
jgi:hypothetical protein